MSDPPRPRDPANPDEPARLEPEADPNAEFDLPFTLAPRSPTPSARRVPAAIRAFLFFTAAFLVGAEVGQSVGLAVALGLQGNLTLLLDPEQLPAALPQLSAQPLVIFCMGLFSALLVLGITAAFTCGWERRPLASVGFQTAPPAAGAPGAGQQLAVGLALGAGLMVAIFVVEAGLGWLRITRVLPLPQGLAHAAVWLIALLPMAVAEEMMLRGYPFQALEEQWGGNAALMITALVFGALHGINPHAGWGSFGGIVVSGILFGAAFLVTRRLWLPIGLHAAWNLFEGPVLGFPVSGFAMPGAITTAIAGPPLWTGGSFGPEAGLLGALASAAGAVVLLAITRPGLPR